MHMFPQSPTHRWPPPQDFERHSVGPGDVVLGRYKNGGLTRIGYGNSARHAIENLCG